MLHMLQAHKTTYAHIYMRFTHSLQARQDLDGAQAALAASQTQLEEAEARQQELLRTQV